MDEYISFDDVVIVPGSTPVEPHEIDIAGKVTRHIELALPVVSSPMDTVTEYQMAIALGRLGAVGVIHRNMSIEEQVNQVRRVKEANPSYWASSPRIGYSESVDSAIFRIEESGVGAGVVIKPDGSRWFMIADTANAHYWLEKVMWMSRILTMLKPLPSLDGEGRLIVGAAVSPYDVRRAIELERAGVDFLVTDVAHLHNQNAVTALSKLVKSVGVDVVAGNLGTRQGVLDVIAKAEDVAGLRMGISSGSICITGEVAGTAVPTLTAVMNARSALEELGLFGKIPIMADGGIRGPGDAAKAVIAGASSVMVGRFLAGTEESPGPKIRVGDKTYKTYRGMASRGAMERRHASDRYSKPSKAIEEGVEGLVPYSGPVEKKLAEMVFGLQAALGYAGASNIPSAWSARLARVTPGSRSEIRPHDIIT